MVGYAGGGVASRINFRASRAQRPLATASGLMISRCSRTAGAIALTIAGVTKSFPCRKARPCAPRARASVPRGLAPRRRSALWRVAEVICATYRATDGERCTFFTLSRASRMSCNKSQAQGDRSDDSGFEQRGCEARLQLMGIRGRV